MTIITEKDVNSVIAKLNKVTTLRRLKPLSVVETAIIRGLLEGQSYEDIAKGAFYTCQHVRTSGSRLLRILSAHYREEINPDNLRLIYKSCILNSKAKDAAEGLSTRCPFREFGDADVSFFIGKISDILFEETGKHLLSTESSALRGVLSGVTYRDSASLSSSPRFIPDKYRRMSCRIFDVLSARFGVKFKKANFTYMCERYLSD